MVALPATMLERLGRIERNSAESWWAGLTDSARDRLAILYDPCADSCSFAMEPGENGPCGWHPIPVTVDSDLIVESDEPDADWDADFFAYLVLNPERYPVPQYEPRPFLIGGHRVARLAGYTGIAVVQDQQKWIISPIGAIQAR